MNKKKKPLEPTLHIEVTKYGVSKIKIAYRTLAEEEAARLLQQKCAVVISLLSEVARGTASEIKPLAPAPPIEQLLQP